MSARTSPILTTIAAGPTPVPLVDLLRHVVGGDAPSWLGTLAPPVVDAAVVASAPGDPHAPEGVVPHAETERDPSELVEEARATAEQEGLAIAQAKVEAVVERYFDGIQRLLDVATRAARPRGEDVVELAMVLARELAGRELSVDRERLAGVIDEALRGVEARPEVTIRLSRGDCAYLRRRRPELEADGVTLVCDETIGPGGCQIETREWVRDLTIEARLAAVRDALASLVDGQVEPPPDVLPDVPSVDAEDLT